ncbi:uncharacterized protein [Haliotis asinina]|uniref:uncharacterized protein n=1 Tax=Haliotis asinina TaxID=109174 RepID=UPI0035318E23
MIYCMIVRATIYIHLFRIQIQVPYKDVLYNVSSELTCPAPIGVPPKWPEGLQPSPDVTDTQFILNHFEFWDNGTNGPITKRLLYIAKHKRKLVLQDDKSGYIPAIRIGCCREGSDKVCKTGHCTTHLAPDTIYYYVVVGCTKRGCTKSPIFDFRTNKDNTTSIVVAMLVTVVIIAATIIAAALLWRSKKRNTNNTHSDEREGTVDYRVYYRNSRRNGWDWSMADYISPTVERPSPEYEALHVYEEVQ